MLSLFIQAPFATFRTFTAGWYRPTATFLTPSAAYGLLLNLAGIESRLREGEEGHDGRVPASLTRPVLPPACLALGAPPGDCPEQRVRTAYQQLHNYPVGTSGQERAEAAWGNKYNITPVRRELLMDLRAFLVLKAPELEDRVRRGLRGELNEGRYGLPFLGDNSFLIDRIEELPLIPLAHWYEKVSETSAGGLLPGTARLTIRIDRADLSQTTSALFARTEEPMNAIPEAAWVEFLPSPASAPPPPTKKGRK